MRVLSSALFLSLGMTIGTVISGVGAHQGLDDGAMVEPGPALPGAPSTSAAAEQTFPAAPGAASAPGVGVPAAECEALTCSLDPHQAPTS